jgi:hypothetical protein
MRPAARSSTTEGFVVSGKPNTVGRHAAYNPNKTMEHHNNGDARTRIIERIRWIEGSRGRSGIVP